MKNNVLKLIIALLCLGVFNVVFFVGGFHHCAANWYTYAFATVAFLCLVGTPLFTKGSSAIALVGSLWLRAALFFITELVVACGFLLASPESATAPVIVQSVLLVAFLVLQLMSVMANDHTTASLHAQQQASFAKEALVGKLQQQVFAVNDPAVREHIDRALDALQNLPLQSFPETRELDVALENKVDELCQTVAGGQAEQVQPQVSQLLGLIQQRNLLIRRCRAK